MVNFRSISFMRTIAILLVVAGGAAVLLSFLEDQWTRHRRLSILSNMKQLQLATEQMALDRDSSGNTNIGWPGDTGGSFSNWVGQLVSESYLSLNDLRVLLSAPGLTVSAKDPLTNNRTALLVYAVSTNSPATAVFLSTANFTNTPTGGIVNHKAKPYGNRGFVVLCKGSYGAILQSHQAGHTNIIGSYVPLCK